MAIEHRTDDWESYKMEYKEPFKELESAEAEIAVVDATLATLKGAGALPHTSYDLAKMLAHRQAVRDTFEIPWTGITLRMQRLLYAINAILQPNRMVAAGIFCGNTFISNAGAAVGPGACYEAEDLVGLEIKPDEAERAERNVRGVDPTGVARIIAGDAIPFVTEYEHPIDILYLDADGDKGRGKGIYLEILEAAYDKMPKGSVALAHNSVNGSNLEAYFEYVRDKSNFSESVNVIFDPEGLEVSVK